MIESVRIAQSPFMKFETLYNKSRKSSNNADTLLQTKFDFPWVNNPIIISALDELRHVKFSQEDSSYMKSLGMEQIFESGEEAVNFIKKSNLRIVFADTGSDSVHAQYDYSENKILLNKKYQNTSDTADILAIAEAILHESCHAKDNDPNSSIQEELNNLSMGAMAHKYFEKKYPSVFNSADTLIVKDGVNIYARLFFDKDVNKKALKLRMKQKYGLLPVGDNIHRPQKLAISIKHEHL